MVQIFVLAILLIVVPVIIGRIFSDLNEETPRLLFCWVSGQVCLWAGFLAICVPRILKEKSFSEVVVMFAAYMAVMLLLSVGMGIKRGAKNFFVFRPSMKVSGGKKDAVTVLLWCCAAALLLLQLALACTLAYEEGDDAFYVAISTITVDADTMYFKIPYTGYTTGLDARHGLAPFPIWVAMLSKITGIHAATIAQIVLPVVLIVMSYGIYFQIGKHMFREKGRRLPLFMLLLELLVIFGGYSLYSAENFLLVRTAQGKAVLANIVIPFLFLLFLILLEKVQEKRTVRPKHWLLLLLTMAAGCLCSTQGAMLTCVLLGIVGMCTVASYHKWNFLLPILGCCIVPLGMTFLYFWLS